MMPQIQGHIKVKCCNLLRTFGMFSIEAQEDMNDLPCCQEDRRRYPWVSS